MTEPNVELTRISARYSKKPTALPTPCFPRNRAPDRLTFFASCCTTPSRNCIFRTWPYCPLPSSAYIANAARYSRSNQLFQYPSPSTVLPWQPLQFDRLLTLVFVHSAGAMLRCLCLHHGVSLMRKLSAMFCLPLPA